MRTYLVAFAISFAVAGLLTPLLKALAPLVGGIDRAQSSRKVHQTPIPRIGGVAIVVAFFAPLLGLFVYENDVSSLLLSNRGRVAGLFIGGLVIAALGFYDDLRGANAKQKLAVQVAVASLMYFLGYKISLIANPFGGAFSLGVLSFPFTVLWIVGIINAMNLIDGLDGLAGGVAIIVVGLTFSVAFNRPDILMCLLMAALGGALAGFLLYNFNPATIFMGDTGSMFLGFVLAVSTVASSQKSSTAVAMLVPVVALGLPILDTFLAIVRRAMRGRPLFSADREHIHHRLLARGLSHRQAVLLLYAFCLVLAAFAFTLTYASSRQVALLLGSLAAFVIVALRGIGYRWTDRDAARQNALSRARNRTLRGLVREVGDRLKQADRLEVVWDAVKYVAPALGARRLMLSVVVRESEGEQVRSVLTWRDAEPGQRGGAECTVRLQLDDGRSRDGLGEFEVVWSDGRRTVDRDDEIAIETIAGHLEGALVRLQPAVTDTAEPVQEATVVPLRIRSER